MILDGGRTGHPKLEWKDGSVSVMTVTDTGITGDVDAVVSYFSFLVLSFGGALSHSL